MKRYNCHIDLKDVPSIGFKTVQIIPTKKNEKSKEKNLVRLSAGLPILENDNLKVQINKNGTFNVYDKLNDTHFQSLGYFYDEGEAGHAWVNKPTKPFLNTLNQKPEIKIIHKGNLFSAVSINYNWRIPQNRLSSKQKQNKDSITILPIEVIVSVNKYSKRVDLKIKLENNSRESSLKNYVPDKY